MKYTILREKLLTTLQSAGFFTSYKLGDIEALKGVLIKANSSGISLRTTNLADSFYGKVGGKVDIEGEVLVDYKTFLEVIKNVRDEKIVVEKVKNDLHIKTSAGVVKIPTVDESLFPTEQEGEWEDQERNLFKQREVEEVAFAAATDETRPILTGIFYDIREDGIFMVATDGFRLSLVTKKGEEKIKKTKRKFIIPSKSIQTALKTLGKEETKVQIDKEYSRMRVVAENSYITIRFLEGEFPPYEKAIPQQAATSARFKAEDFQNALKTVSLFSKEGSNMVELTIKDTEIELYSVRSTNGEARLNIPLLGKEGKNNKIVFNHKFLSAFFSINQAKEVVFEMEEPNTPGLFKAEGKNNFIHIIMPIRSQE
ncbi:MAG: DNA polymerase III subunit beta [Candidatus Roizmanbacteria bacterium]|nr:DNA polymerase III subunit beta [Candidatus Roizmanbacteria bacterium]